MLIPLPIGLWVFALVADIVYRAGGAPVWDSIAYYDLLGGIVGALLAAVFGFVDFLQLPRSRARDLGIQHMSLNLVIVGLQIASFWLRSVQPAGAGLPFVLSIVAIVLLLVSGWLGWEMVYRHGVALDRDVTIRLQEREQSRRGAA